MKYWSIYLLLCLNLSCVIRGNENVRIDETSPNHSFEEKYHSNGNLKSRTIIYRDSCFIREYFNYYKRIKTIVSDGKKLPNEVQYISNLARGYFSDSAEIITSYYVYYRNNQLASYSYLLLNGNMRTTRYSLEGYITEVADYASNHLNGLYSSYYPNNQLKILGNYELGNKSGEWKYWSKSGVLLKKEIYENGVKIKTLKK